MGGWIILTATVDALLSHHLIKKKNKNAEKPVVNKKGSYFCYCELLQLITIKSRSYWLEISFLFIVLFSMAQQTNSISIRMSHVISSR